MSIYSLTDEAIQDLDEISNYMSNFNIYDDSLPEESNPISDNGHHEGIAIRINGEERVFDNHHPDGVPTKQWMDNLTFPSKDLYGASFRESGYLF